MPILSDSYLLHFWSPFPEPIIQEVCQSLETVQKADNIFTAAILQSDFIENLEELEATGFFKDLAFLDNFDAIEYTKQDDSVVIANPYENGQNSNNSTKETSPHRSLRISKRRPHVIEKPSSQQPRYALSFKKKVVAEKTQDITFKALEEKHGVNRKTIAKWVKKSSSLKTV